MFLAFKQTLQIPCFISPMANFTLRNLLVCFLFQKRYLTTCSKIRLPEITKDSNFPLHFLTNSCGLPLKSAISVSHKFQIKEKNEKKLQSVIDYLKDEGFTQSHIAELIQKLPKVLHCKVEANLKPKLEFLKQNGFVGELLTHLIVKNPKVVKTSLASQLKPCLELLRSYLGTGENVLLATRRYPWLFSKNVDRFMQPNIDFLVKQGVPASSIAKIITLQPRAIEHKHSKTIYVVNAVKNLGLQPNSPMFVQAFRVMISMSESTLKNKVKLLQSFGWTEEEIFTAFKKFPCIMTCSEGKIRKSLDFYLNTMKLDLQTIMTYPVLFGLAIHSRVRPRYVILKILESKKLIKEDRHRMNFLYLSDKAFLDKYITKYEDCVPGLLDVHSASKSDEKIAS